MSNTIGDHEVVVPQSKNPWLSDKTYTKLEYLARVVLPALATLYLALGTLWSFPYGPQVVGTIVAIDTFLGVFIGFAQKSYDASDAAYNGSIVVTKSPDGTALSSLVLDQDPAELGKIVLKINPDEPAA
jgi:hypothetical protein